MQFYLAAIKKVKTDPLIKTGTPKLIQLEINCREKPDVVLTEAKIGH